jgi:hypothetical protein
MLREGERIEPAPLREPDEALEVGVVVIEAFRQAAMYVQVDLLHCLTSSQFS